MIQLVLCVVLGVVLGAVVAVLAITFFDRFRRPRRV
jgi:hypothetical protein